MSFISLLFNIYIQYVINEALEDIQEGVKVGGVLIHSATVLVAFAFQSPPSGTHSHKTYEAVTFPGNSSSVDLRHGCLNELMCRWRV